MTSTVTKGAMDGRGESFSEKFRNFFVSLMCDGRLLA